MTETKKRSHKHIIRENPTEKLSITVRVPPGIYTKLTAYYDIHKLDWSFNHIIVRLIEEALQLHEKEIEAAKKDRATPAEKPIKETAAERKAKALFEKQQRREIKRVYPSTPENYRPSDIENLARNGWVSPVHEPAKHYPSMSAHWNVAHYGDPDTWNDNYQRILDLGWQLRIYPDLGVCLWAGEAAHDFDSLEQLVERMEAAGWPSPTD